MGRAERQRTSLNWVRGVGAERCPGAQEVAARLEQLLGPLLVTPSEANLTIEAGVTRSAHGFVGRALATGANGNIAGQRTWQVGHQCQDVVEQVVLVVALMIDPTYMEDVSAAFQLEDETESDLTLLGDDGGDRMDSSGSVHDVATPMQESTGSPTMDEREAEGSQENFLGGVEFLIAQGVQPTTSLGLAATALWQWGALGVIGSASGMLPSEQQAPGALSSASMFTIALKPGACVKFAETAGARIHGCLGVGLTMAFAQGREFSQSHAQKRLLPTAWSGIVLQLGSRQVGGLGRIGLDIPLQRLRLTYDNGGSRDLLYEQPRIAGFLSIGAYFGL